MDLLVVRSRGVYNDEDLIKGHTVPLIRALNLRRARDSVLEAGILGVAYNRLKHCRYFS